MMHDQEITLEVSFMQLAVFRSSLEQPFNDWSDAQVAQGFSWRSDSVSFRTIEDGPHSVRVIFAHEMPSPDPAAVRAITVPLDVLDGHFAIASISDSVSIHSTPGKYQILCEFLKQDEGKSRRVNIVLASTTEDYFAILVADSELNLSGPLEINPESAVR
jgi:hypothetical protein